MEPGLPAYVLKRLGFAVLMLFGVSIILFAIMRVAPGGPEAVLVGGEFSPEAAARVRQRLGLDRPLVTQYARWSSLSPSPFRSACWPRCDDVVSGTPSARPCRSSASRSRASGSASC